MNNLLQQFQEKGTGHTKFKSKRDIDTISKRMHFIHYIHTENFKNFSLRKFMKILKNIEYPHSDNY